MGGGDLNMKKSWHPLLRVNQEKVWKKEKEALEERRKLEELRREREQERELQELQRLQEASGGKKRADKVDWMYATPSAGSGPSANELEDYLLGKKSVDKLLQAKDTPVASSSNAAVGPGAGAQAGFMATSTNANSARDLASKIRADPLLAIKQQEQAAYQALIKDPARLRQLQEANGIVVGESKEERRKRKEEKRRAKEERRAERERGHDRESARDEPRRHSSRDRRGDEDSRRHHQHRDDRSRSRSPLSPPRRRSDSRSPPRARQRRDEREHGEDRSHSRYETSTRGHQEPARRDYDRHPPHRADDDRRYRDGRGGPPERRRYDDLDGRRSRSRSPPPRARYENGRDGPDRRDRNGIGSLHKSEPRPYNERDRHVSHRDPARTNGHASHGRDHASAGPTPESLAAERAAKLAAMQAAASSLSAQRSVQLSQIKEEEEAEKTAEEAARLRAQLRAGAGSKGKEWEEGGAKGSFLLAEQSKMFGVGGGEGGAGMDLAERVRRGRGRLEKLGED